MMMPSRWLFVGLVSVALVTTACGGHVSSTKRQVLSKCETELASAKPPMPFPTRLTTVLTYRSVGTRLSPPPRNDRPAVSASRAWRTARGMQTGGTYVLTLVDLNSGYSPPTSNVLDWAVLGSHVAIRGGRVAAPRPANGSSCVFESEVWTVDATTGLFNGTFAFPPSSP
jgi:hypothetical protein